MEILVVGGGCIGLGVAGELARDHRVVLQEAGRCGRGASYAAAGMVAPIMEVEYGELELLRLGQRSRELYPGFVEELEAETDCPVGLRSKGTLGVALSRAEAEDLDRLFEYQNRLDLDVEEISPERCRELEPRISDYVTRAVLCRSEIQVDNRKLTEALRRRCERRGVRIHERDPVERVRCRNGSVVSVETRERSHEPDLTLIAAGVGSPRIEGLSGADRVPVRPVKGQAVAVRLSDPPEVEHVIRTPKVYCVPKDDGRLVIGATMEEQGYDRRVTAGGVLDQLHRGYETLPFIYEQELLETWAGLRPASRDSLPILGPSAETKNLGFATGHFRNGILLTPITVQLISGWVNDGSVPDEMEPFLPARFQEARDEH